jgi:hypothetical protein
LPTPLLCEFIGFIGFVGFYLIDVRSAVNPKNPINSINPMNPVNPRNQIFSLPSDVLRVNVPGWQNCTGAHLAGLGQF